MNTGLVIFLFVVVVAIIVIACALAVYVGRHFVSQKFDERQQIDRGNAYRLSHWVGMVYYFGLLIYFVLHTGKSEWTLEPFLLIMIGILIQLDSFHVYCLMTHSALPLGEKPLATVVSYASLGVVYLLQYVVQYIPEDKVAAAGIIGATSYNLLRLLVSLSFFFLAICHLISLAWKEKE